MAEEYTPSGSPVTFTVPVYEEVADGPKLAKDLADDVAEKFSIPGRTETLVGKTLTTATLGTDLAANNKKITGLSDPSSAQDAVTKSWAETGMTSQLTLAEDAKTAALAAQVAAELAETNAETAEVNAETAQTASEAAQAAAETAETGAETAQAAAATSATNSASSASTSTTQATAATSSASSASTSAALASASESAAAASQAAAASSESNSATSAGSATTSATSASTSATASATSAAASQTSRLASETAEGLASASQVAAATSASNASASQSATASSAAASAASQAAAATSETNSATSASGASTSATDAAASAVDSANSAAAAATALDSFDDRYLGAKSVAPTLDNDGDALLQGALFYLNTGSSEVIGMYVFDGAGWLKASAASVASIITYEYTATAAQTVFSGADDNAVSMTFTAGLIQVFLNGVFLNPGDDYTTGVNSVTLASGTAADDTLTVVAFASFNVANTYTIAQTNAEIASATAGLGSSIGEGGFFKADTNTVAFTKTGAGTVSITAGSKVWVNGAVVTFTSATAITMPTLTAGTDYYVYVTAGGIQAVAATGTWPTPVASPPADSRLIGGFHYAAGGNAAAQAGGDTTAAINEYSLWDVKWKPVCVDPRGMTLVANRFWSDIYLLNRDPQTHGTSKNNQPIADGETASITTCIVPTAFGGNGSTRYATHSWWNTAEALSAFGKRLPRYSEFGSLAYGVTENVSRGNDPVTTGFGTTNAGSSNTDNKFTSKWGVVQASGVLWAWGDEFGGGNAAASFANVNGGRGQVYQQENAVFLGGNWSFTVYSGSRSSNWYYSPSSSYSYLVGRGVCDHLILV